MGTLLLCVCCRLDLLECLSNVGEKVLGALEAAGETYHVGGNARGEELFVGHLTVRGARGMQAAGACIGNMGLDSGNA